ncbi:MAG TPA: tetratricopeptide repeat protein [Steroidobacteraceae bacterium]|nr:tetratricopeptide repeat protein [Steroidobacteraceae bacterium]
MKATSRLLAALVLGAAMITVPAFTPDGVVAAQEKPKVSKAVAKPLKAAQDALNAKKWQEALARLKEVQAIPAKSPYDEFLMNEMLGFAYVRTSQFPDAARHLEAGFNSQYFDQAQTASRVNALAQVNYQLKNYDKAVEYGNRAIKGGFADDDMYTLVGQAHYIKGDYKGTLRFMNNYVDSIEKRGGTPKEQSLELIMSSCIKLDDAECTTKALERLVSRYPKPVYWQNLMYSLFKAQDNNDKQLLHIYRLASEVDVLKRPEDYTEMAQLAIEQGSPGEAQRILEKGIAKNVFAEQRDKDRNTRLLESAKKQAATDQASIPKMAKEAEAANATGDRLVGLGIAYMSYQQYDKAADAFQRALAKGSVKNPEEAQIFLGIAQLKQQKKDEALKAFRAVKNDPKLTRIASLWALHAQQSPTPTAKR